MVNSEQVQYGGVEVVHVNFVLGNTIAIGVALPVDRAGLGSTAG